MGGAITAVMVVLILIGYFWTPYDPGAMDASAKALPPSLAHIMGTDNFGRDIFSRVLQELAQPFYFSVRRGHWCLSGYGYRCADRVFWRLGRRNPDAPVRFHHSLSQHPAGAGGDCRAGAREMERDLVLGILFIPSFARIVRGEFARCKHLNYIKSARLMGAGPVRIMVRHILPNTLPVLLPAISIGFNNAVLAEASMSFLGVGVSATEPSLGRMLSDGQGYLLRGLPWYALCVGMTIVLLILGFSLLSEGLAAAPPPLNREETAMLEVKKICGCAFGPARKNMRWTACRFIWTTGKFWDLWAKAVLERV